MVGGGKTGSTPAPSYKDIDDFDAYFDSIAATKPAAVGFDKSFSESSGRKSRDTPHVRWASESSIPRVDVIPGSTGKLTDEVDTFSDLTSVDDRHVSAFSEDEEDQQPGQFPFLKGRAVAKAYRLPGQSDYGCRGQLYRSKGKWKRKWAREWFIIQHNVLLTCTKEQPFLVKVCIPLRNIQSIEPIKGRGAKDVEGLLFEIRYIEAARKGKEKFGTMQCQAETVDDAQFWIQNLRKFRDHATSPSAALADYVVRDNAEAAISQLHDAMKNSGLFYLVSRLGSSVSREEKERLQDAFWRLRENWLNRGLMAQKERYDTGLQVAEHQVQEAKKAGKIELANAQRFGRLTVLLSKLAFLVNSKKHLALMALKRNTDMDVTMAMTEGVQDVLMNTLLVEHSLAARREFDLRRKHLCFALEQPFRRVLGEGWQSLVAGSYIIANREEMKKKLLETMLALRAAKQNEIASKVLWKWKVKANLHRRRMEAMQKVFQICERVGLHFAWRRWTACCLLRNQQDIRCFVILDKVLRRKEALMMSGALRDWSRWSNESQTAAALQIAANFNYINESLTESFNKVPRERACYLLSLAIQKMIMKRQAITVHRIRTYGARREVLLRNCSIGISLLEKARKNRLSNAFLMLLKFAFRCHFASSQRLIGLMQLTVALHLAVKKRTAETLLLWKRNLGPSAFGIVSPRGMEPEALDGRAPSAETRRPRSPDPQLSPSGLPATTVRQRNLEGPVKKTARCLERIRLAHLALSWSLLRGHCHEVDLVRGLARSSCLERACHLLQRACFGALAFAWCRLVQFKESGNLTLPATPTDLAQSLGDRRRRVVQEILSLPRVSANSRRHSDVAVQLTPHKSSRQRRNSAAPILHTPKASLSPAPATFRQFPAPQSTEVQRSVTSGLAGRLVWLGIGLTQNENQTPSLILQAHRAVPRNSRPNQLDEPAEGEASGTAGVVKSPAPSKVPWKRPGHHNTIRSAGIKKSVMPTSGVLKISPKKIELRKKAAERRRVQPFPLLGSSPPDTLTSSLGGPGLEYFGTSDSANTDLREFHDQERPESFRTARWGQLLEYSDTDGEPLHSVDPFMFSSGDEPNDARNRIYSTMGGRVLSHHFPGSRLPSEHHSSPDLPRPLHGRGLLGMPSRDLPRLGTGSSDVMRDIEERRSPRGAGDAEMEDEERFAEKASLARIEEWIRASQKYVETVGNRDRTRFSSSMSSRETSLEWMYWMPQGLEDEVNYLMPSSKGSLLRNATGETPDIDFDRIHDFVFDDGMSEIDMDGLLSVPSDESMGDAQVAADVVAEQHARRQSRGNSIHGAPVDLPTTPEDSARQQRPQRGGVGTRMSQSSRGREHHMDEFMQQAPTSPSALPSRRVYRAAVQSSPRRQGRPSSQGGQSPGTPARASPAKSRPPKRLIILPGETGGADSPSDLTIVASSASTKKKLKKTRKVSEEGDQRKTSEKPKGRKDVSEAKPHSQSIPEHRVILSQPLKPDPNFPSKKQVSRKPLDSIASVQRRPPRKSSVEKPSSKEAARVSSSIQLATTLQNLPLRSPLATIKGIISHDRPPITNLSQSPGFHIRTLPRTVLRSNPLVPLL